MPTSSRHAVDDRGPVGMTQLFRELDYSEEHSSVLISLGLHSKLLQAIRRCPEDHGVQCSVLHALTRLGTTSHKKHSLVLGMFTICLVGGWTLNANDAKLCCGCCAVCLPGAVATATDGKEWLSTIQSAMGHHHDVGQVQVVGGDCLAALLECCPSVKLQLLEMEAATRCSERAVCSRAPAATLICVVCTPYRCTSWSHRCLLC